jgi:hypothetical protein
MTFSKNRQQFFSLLLSILLYIFPGQAQATNTSVERLPQIAAFPQFQVGDGIIFSEQNPGKKKIIQETLSRHGLNQGISLGNRPQDTFRFLKTQKPFQTPIIEFRRINPTKFRIRVHGMRENFPLVFSERYHHNWHLYLVPLKFQQSDMSNQNTQQLLSSYKIFEGNNETQAGPEELNIFFAKGLVTSLMKDPPSLLNPYHLMKKLFPTNTQLVPGNTAFISKNFKNSIQNDNLPTSVFWETWFAGKIEINCNDEAFNRGDCQWTDPSFWEKKPDHNKNVFAWPEKLHWQANSLTNSWWINRDVFPQLFPSNNEKTVFYRSNSDGTIDFELVMEFWPQRLFYVGGILSLSVFIFCLIALFLRWVRS